MVKLKLISIFGLVFLFCLIASADGQTVSGSVCLAPFAAPNNGEKNLSNPSGGNRIQNYEVQIDNKTKVKVSNTDSKKISVPFDNKRHWVKIFGDGKAVESFRFGFNDYSSGKLCLFFNSLYETWSLWSVKEAGKICRCK